MTTRTRVVDGLRVGQIVGRRWTVTRHLGDGGAAHVYEAVHRNGSRAALKFLAPHLLSDRAARERFRHESVAAARVDHPVVARVIDEDETEHGDPYLVLELLEGGSLQDEWREGGLTVPLGRTLQVMERLLDGLAACHDAGVVHRDVKPANVLVLRSGAVKLIDFGVALVPRGVSDAQLPAVVGTPAYMAPEQARGEPDLVDGRADLFSVGATMHALLTGRRVREGATEAERLERAASGHLALALDVLRADDVEVAQLVERALASRPEDRFSDARAMRGRLLAVFDRIGLAPIGGRRAQVHAQPLFQSLVARGVLGAGAIVELGTGEIGQLISADPPRLRIVSDERRAPLRSPVEIDLASDAARTVEVARLLAERGDVAALLVGEPPSDETPSRGLEAGLALAEAFADWAGGAEESAPALESFDLEATGPHRAMTSASVPEVERPAPTATGTLSSTPLPHVLVYMLDHGLSGSVALEDVDGAETVLVFARGALVKVSARTEQLRLGEMLVRRGLLELDAVERAVSDARAVGLLLGEILVGDDRVSARALDDVLELQALERVARLARLDPSTRYRFFRGVDLAPEVGGAPVRHPLSAVHAAVRAWRDRPRLSASLARLGGATLRLDPLARLEGMRLASDEAPLLGALRGRGTTLRELRSLGVAPTAVVDGLVYTLAITRQLAQTGSSRTPMGATLTDAPAVTRAAAPVLRVRAPDASPSPFAPESVPSLLDDEVDDPDDRAATDLFERPHESGEPR